MPELMDRSLISCFLGLFFNLIFFPDAASSVLPVGPTKPYPNLEQAAAQARPGDTLLFDPGVYAGDQSVAALQGSPEKPIYLLPAEAGTVIISGGRSAWHLSNAQYLHIEGFIFEKQTGNGLNIDDGSDYSTPTHHISLVNCTFRDIQAAGNNDLLKLSGVDDFELIACSFENGAKGGSGIDMVGCHRGRINQCRFENLGSNSIQAKGGSAHIVISRNYFKKGGQRTLNLGGSTGMPFFRPMDATYEVADLLVYSNIIVGSDAPIAYVGAVRTQVVHNTIINPNTWVIRILQETVNEQRFIPCGDNVFQNNLIYYTSTRTEVNVGANTRPESFTFSSNLWYNATHPDQRPQLPVAVPQLLYGKDPLFVNLKAEDLRLQNGSPAAGQAVSIGSAEVDYYGRPFAGQLTIGAISME
jgi:hypothetical protein